MKTIIITWTILVVSLSIAKAEDTKKATDNKTIVTKDLQCIWIPSAKLMVCTRR